jgi:hypothetical protein
MLKYILNEYSEIVKEERGLIQNNFSFLFHALSEKPKDTCNYEFYKKTQEIMIKQINKYFKLQEKEKGTDLSYLKLKENRYNHYVRKIELINAFRQLGEFFINHINQFTKENMLGQIAEIFDNSQSPEISEIVKLYFLSLLNSKTNLLEEYKQEYEPFFKEYKQLRELEFSLLSKEQFEEYEEIKANIERSDLETSEKFDRIKEKKGFYYFATLILNNLFMLKIKNTKDKNTNMDLLDQKYLDLIDCFRDRNEMKYTFLKKLSIGFCDSELLNLFESSMNTDPLKNKNNKIMLINIIIWVLASEEYHPLYLLLKDLREGKTETQKFVYNVYLNENQKNIEKDHYTVHSFEEKYTMEKMKETKDEESARFWHFILHALFLGVSDIKLIENNRLKSDIENSLKGSDIPANNMNEYLKQHFENDLKILKKKQKIYDLMSPFFVHSINELQKDQDANKNSVEIGKIIATKFSKYCKNKDIIIEVEEMLKEMNKNLVGVDLFSRNFIKKVLTEKQRERIQEPFLFVNLREINNCNEEDLQKTLMDKQHSKKYLFLRHFMKYQVFFYILLIILELLSK